MAKPRTLSVVLPGVMMIAAAAIILPAPTTIGARVLQHLLGLAVQILAAGLAAAFVWQAAREFGVDDRERRTWGLLGLAMLSWTTGLVFYAAAEWFGRRPSFPSASDAFYVASLLAIGMAMGHAIRLVQPALTSRQRLVLGGGAVVVWAALIVEFHWPILAGPLDPVERTLHMLYSTAPALLLPLGLACALGYRNSATGHAWVVVTAGVGCLSLANLGYAYLSWFDLYTDIHPVNLLRVAGFALLISGATWHRAAGPLVAVREVTTAPAPRASGEYVSTGTRTWRSTVFRDVPLLVSLGTGAVVGALVVLLMASVGNRAQGVPPTAPSPVVERRQPAPAAPAPVMSAPPAESRPAPEATRSLTENLDSISARYRSATQMLAQGRLREAQDAFLEILFQDPDDQKAMQGLITVRRRLAGNDPARLRQQAAAYQQAIARGAETDEHYTIQAMAVLARASLMAATEIDAERRRGR